MKTKNVTRRQALRRGLQYLADGSALIVLGPALSATVARAAAPSVDPGVKKGPYAYLIDAEKCIGCGSCGRACRRENDVPEGHYRTWIERYTYDHEGNVGVDSPSGGEKGFPANPIKTEVADAFFVPKMCNHCRNPPCVQVCPVGATFATEDGVVLVDREHCVGCAYCVQSCPYGARFINPELHVADKCTWCFHRIRHGKLPACVASCPAGARSFGSLSDPDSAIVKKLRKMRVAMLKPDLGTEPAVLYNGISKEVR